jgi:hypothetical protein
MTRLSSLRLTGLMLSLPSSADTLSEPVVVSVSNGNTVTILEAEKS